MATNSTNEPIIAYYDKTHGSLKFASFGAIRWHSHVVDIGIGTPDTGGDDVGRWTSMTMGPDGKPAIAYSAWVAKGVSGMPESQLRWAQANTTTPQSSSDWTVLEAAAEGKPGKVRLARSYPLKPGDAHVYNEGDVHSPRREGATKLIRVEGTNMEKVKRLAFEKA